MEFFNKIKNYAHNGASQAKYFETLKSYIKEEKERINYGE